MSIFKEMYSVDGSYEKECLFVKWTTIKPEISQMRKQAHYKRKLLDELGSNRNDPTNNRWGTTGLYIHKHKEKILWNFPSV